MSRYSLKEVEGLVQNYTVLKEAKSTYGIGLMILVRLADLDRAISQLPPKEYLAILLYGQLNHTVRDAEQILQIAKSTLQDRYASGVRLICRYLNEGVDD